MATKRSAAGDHELRKDLRAKRSRRLAELVDEYGEDSLALSNEERMLIINRLHEVLRPFMLRRVKANVLGQLPEKVEKVLRCDLTAWQKVVYEQIRSSGAAAVARRSPGRS